MAEFFWGGVLIIGTTGDDNANGLDRELVAADLGVPIGLHLCRDGYIKSGLRIADRDRQALVVWMPNAETVIIKDMHIKVDFATQNETSHPRHEAVGAVRAALASKSLVVN